MSGRRELKTTRDELEQKRCTRCKASFSDKARESRGRSEGRRWHTKNIASGPAIRKRRRHRAVMRTNYDPSIPCHRVIAASAARVATTAAGSRVSVNLDFEEKVFARRENSL